MNSAPTQPFLLAGDIGGTKTTLALYQDDGGHFTPSAESTFKNAGYGSFDQIIETFLRDTAVKPQAACFGVAGPIRNNRVKMTNLPWILEAEIIEQRFGLQRVTLINDLVATALGSVHLPPDKLLTLNKGRHNPHGAIAVIAPGTGLGEAFLVRCHNNWLPVPSEGGHGSFAPIDELQRQLLHYMAARHSYVSTEMVCSGRGIPSLFDFLCEHYGVDNDTSLHPGSTRLISETALSALDSNEEQNIALQTMRLFSAILAAEASNLVLKILASGGLYIGGGIPPRILPFLQPEEFMHTFARGEYRELLAAVPVHVILEPKTALIGAAVHGLDRINATGDAT